MIAHAGATLATLAVMPLVKPRQPSSCQMSRRAEKTLYLFVVIRVGVFALKLLRLVSTRLLTADNLQRAYLSGSIVHRFCLSLGSWSQNLRFV